MVFQISILIRLPNFQAENQKLRFWQKDAIKKHASRRYSLATLLKRMAFQIQNGLTKRAPDAGGRCPPGRESAPLAFSALWLLSAKSARAR